MLKVSQITEATRTTVLPKHDMDSSDLTELIKTIAPPPKLISAKPRMDAATTARAIT